MLTGRKKDEIWKYFIEEKPDKSNLKTKRVECKKCHTVIVPLINVSNNVELKYNIVIG